MGAFIVVASIGAITIFLGSCSTIVKGTQQQVSINTPGIPGAIVLPKSKHNVAVSCTAQCYSPGVATLASHTEVMAAGNILFGGVIGLGVDAASGAMNTYDANLDVMMTPIPACGRPPVRQRERGTPISSTPVPQKPVS